MNDFANVIDPATEAEIDRRPDLLEQKTSSVIAVVSVPSLDGMSVDEYANKLFKQWGIGQAGNDNGVLVLVAPTEHRIRIEVGYGLEASCRTAWRAKYASRSSSRASRRTTSTADFSTA